jgi:aerobic-type carbon monoxide dehydrogenase small subunit (CoxS/CutS family)
VNENSTLTLTFNGSSHTVKSAGVRTLLSVLRDELGLMGAREGCGIGMCGACTVLVDGRAVSSCLMFVQQAQGAEITTGEGVSEVEHLHPIQQAFIDHAAFQCSYCTPGFILSTIELLQEQPDPNEETAREFLAGNLCRCGSYGNILQAVLASRPIKS